MKLPTSISRALKLLMLSSLVMTASCTEYWWTRGQAPGVGVLLTRAQNQFDEAMSSNKYDRKDVAELAKSLESAVLAAHNSAKSKDTSVKTKLGDVINGFAALEGKLSITNRAPYAELFGQARALRAEADRDNIRESAVGLFAARTIFFLANEMSVPAPSFGA